MNPLPIAFYDRPQPHIRDRYTPYLIPDSISVESDNYFIYLATPSNYPDILPSDDPNTLSFMNKYLPLLVRVKRG